MNWLTRLGEGLKNQKKSNLVVWKLLCIILVGAFLSIFRISHHSLWLDEALTINNASDFGKMWSVITTSEPYMWTYMTLFNFWLKLGSGEFFVRLLSSLFFVASIPVFFFAWREIYNIRVVLITLVLYSFHPFLIRYAQEVRGYTMLLFFTGVTTLFFLKFLKQVYKPALIYYVFSGILLIYTHQLGLVILCGQLAFALFYYHGFAKPKTYLLGLLVIFFGTLPLLTIKIPDNAVNWIPKPGLFEVKLYVMSLVGGNMAALLIFLLAFLLGTIGIFKKWASNNSSKAAKLQFYPLVMFVLSIFISYIFSLINRPFFVPRYLIFTIPFVLVICSYGIISLRKVGRYFTIALVLTFLWSLSTWYGVRASNESSWESIIFGQQENWRGAVNFIANNSKNGDYVVFYTYYVRVPFEYYLNRLESKPLLEIPELASKHYTLGGVMPEPNRKLLEVELPQVNHNVWLILSHNINAQLGRDVQTKKIQDLLSVKFNVVQIKDFSGVTVYKYVGK